MPKQILIEEIKIDRELKDGDDLSDLDAAETWPPIVVNENYELIDGLRRIRSAERSGSRKIIAHVISTLEEASDALAEQHTTQLRNWDRLYELMLKLRPLLNDRWMRIRKNNIKRMTSGELDPNVPRGQSRPYVTKALGGLSPAHWEVIERLYEGDYDPKLIEEMRTGRLTPSGAMNRVHRTVKQGDVAGQEEQKFLLNAAVQAMMSAARSLERLMWPLQVPSDDLTELVDQIRKSRKKITIFLNRQSEEAESK